MLAPWFIAGCLNFAWLLHPPPNLGVLPPSLTLTAPHWLRSESECRRRSQGLHHVAEKLGFEDELALLVFLVVLKGFVVLPTDGLLALAAGYVSNNVAACRHATLGWFAGFDINNRVE